MYNFFKFIVCVFKEGEVWGKKASWQHMPGIHDLV